jgi:hypothetical protein
MLRTTGFILCPISGFRDGVARKELGDAVRRYVIKDNEHPQANMLEERASDQGCVPQIQVPR